MILLKFVDLFFTGIAVLVAILIRIYSHKQKSRRDADAVKSLTEERSGTEAETSFIGPEV